MDDLTLRQYILDELEFEPSLDAAHIGVAVGNGVVTLTGQVGSYMEKLAAEHAVQRIKGVRAIAQEIEVRYPEDKKRADHEIAQRALNILAWETSLPEDDLQVKVQNGWITLGGDVEWYFQKDAAERAVRKLSGVVGITNHIAIRPRVDAANIKHRIEDALKRNAEIEANGINIVVNGSHVLLEGTIKAWHERGVAERAAWAAPGVTVVEDHLRLV